MSIRKRGRKRKLPKPGDRDNYPIPEKDKEQNRIIQERRIRESGNPKDRIYLRDVEHLGINAYNSRLNSIARQSFKELRIIEGQLSEIDKQNKIGTTGKEATINNLINTQLNKWGLGLTQQFEKLSPETQARILSQNKKKFGI